MVVQGVQGCPVLAPSWSAYWEVNCFMTPEQDASSQAFLPHFKGQVLRTSAKHQGQTSQASKMG